MREEGRSVSARGERLAGKREGLLGATVKGGAPLFAVKKRVLYGCSFSAGGDSLSGERKCEPSGERIIRSKGQGEEGPNSSEKETFMG